jgi:hypothetical protein
MTGSGSSERTLMPKQLAALEPAQLCLETRAQIVNLIRQSHAMIFPGYPAKRTVVVEDDVAPQSVTDRPLISVSRFVSRVGQ